MFWQKCCKNPKTWWSALGGGPETRHDFLQCWCPSDVFRPGPPNILSPPLADMFIRTWCLYLHALNKHRYSIHGDTELSPCSPLWDRASYWSRNLTRADRYLLQIEDNPRWGSAPRYGEPRSYLTRKISLFTKVAEQCKPNYSELGQKSASKE